MLKVKSIFGVTIQGEGKQAGMPAIFIRLSGCNMWDGRTETRADSNCPFCDTDFRGGEFLTPLAIMERCDVLRGPYRPFLIVLTGGEPLLHPARHLRDLARLLHTRGYKIQVETNGTVNNDALACFDFVTVSPKKPRKELALDLMSIDCLKILHPHPTVKLEDFLELTTMTGYRHIDYCLQPIDVPGNSEETTLNLARTLVKVKELGYPWRLSLQTHKMIGEE